MNDPKSTENREFNPEEFLGLSLLKLLDLTQVLERSVEAELADREVSLVELRVLAVCAAHPGITAVGISDFIPVDAPALSRLVHRLVQKGLISRSRSRVDRRKVRLRATSDELALLKECRIRVEQSELEFLRPLSEGQQASFISAVETLLSANS